MEAKELKPGDEQHEKFFSNISKINLVQYAYRDRSGRLFSCIRKTLDECRAARDAWLTETL